MNIKRGLAIKILKYLSENKDFYFPFFIYCKEYLDKGGELIELEISDLEMIVNDEKYQNFELVENLQGNNSETTELMAKGFIEKITNVSLVSSLEMLAKEYRGLWKVELWESEDIEQFGLNEYYGGKAEGVEDCLDIISGKYAFGISK